MGTIHYDRSIYEEVTCVSGGDFNELRAAVIALDRTPGVSWAVEDSAIVFTVPMGSKMVGREPVNSTQEEK